MSAWLLGAAASVGAQSLVPPSTIAPIPMKPFAGPEASVRVFSAGRIVAASASDLVNGATTSICAASSTGRFRLRVASEMGGALIGPDPRTGLGYRVSFRDPTGAEHEKAMTAGEVVFEARSLANADCGRGANAELSIRSTDQQISSSLAGRYFERIRLTIEPI
ncbi:hypothetical protein [Sphingomonas sp.]|jgi:hypothetical protein|uniref:hypothetical protein n=1 Tax=Sphingomonas sp. TaxID=28214 RepID=UPI00260A75C2|nr:hypothetical protein [Sphingomonas sp.]